MQSAVIILFSLSSLHFIFSSVRYAWVVCVCGNDVIGINKCNKFRSFNLFMCIMFDSPFHWLFSSSIIFFSCFSFVSSLIFIYLCVQLRVRVAQPCSPFSDVHFYLCHFVYGLFTPFSFFLFTNFFVFIPIVISVRNIYITVDVVVVYLFQQGTSKKKEEEIHTGHYYIKSPSYEKFSHNKPISCEI